MKSIAAKFKARQDNEAANNTDNTNPIQLGRQY